MIAYASFLTPRNVRMKERQVIWSIVLKSIYTLLLFGIASVLVREPPFVPTLAMVRFAPLSGPSASSDQTHLLLSLDAS